MGGRPGTPDPWFTCPQPAPQAAWRLYCLPHAGGGTAGYALWGRELAPDIEVTAICPPGRERHLMAPPHQAMAPLVNDLVAVVTPRLQAPYAFFGHSLGALVAFELARALWRRGRGPAYLFVSASRAPHTPPDVPRQYPGLAQMGDGELARVMVGNGGFSPELGREPGMLGLIMPALRADLGIAASYQAVVGKPLPCPITAFGGLDDHGVRSEKLDGWRAVTSGTFTRRLLPGDHFYLKDQRPLVLEAIQHDLAGARPRPDAPDLGEEDQAW
jgi:medium-chain acyl-[acyl-carrier-protein] hydrolase